MDSPVYQSVTPNLIAICLRRVATGVIGGKAGRPSAPADAMHCASSYIAWSKKINNKISAQGLTCECH